MPTDDTWEWDGIAWTEVAALNRPPAHSEHTMAYDQRSRRIVLFGGTGGLGGTWELGYQSSPREERCVTGLDGDGDGVGGCDDPDCWGYCTPMCPPGTPCDPLAPHCGDGMCSADLESCALCPADCGACPVTCGDFLCDATETLATCPGDCTP